MSRVAKVGERGEMCDMSIFSLEKHESSTLAFDGCCSCISFVAVSISSSASIVRMWCCTCAASDLERKSGIVVRGGVLHLQRCVYDGHCFLSEAVRNNCEEMVRTID